jgi:hypothetical protein
MYRMTDDASILLVRGRDGSINYHSHGGPEIRWLNDEQAEHFTRLGLVEPVRTNNAD